MNLPAGELDSNQITYTQWTNKHGKRKRLIVSRWPDFYQGLKDMPCQAEKEGKLIKLATFGDKRTDVGCLRHNDNVLEVTGIEGDYDAEVMTPEQAVELLEAYQLKACVVTTHSHTPATPRFRVYTPFKHPIQPGERLRYAECLNGMLGGVLADESGTLSQSYYIGGNPDSEYKCLHTFDDPEEGFTLDELDEDGKLLFLRMPWSDKKKADGKLAADPENGKQQFEDWISDLCSGESVHPAATRITAHLVAKKWTDDWIKTLFIGLADRVEMERGKERADGLRGKELADLIQSARVKYGSRGYAELIAEAELLNEDSAPEIVEDLARQAGKLTELERERVFKTIKRTTNANMGDLRRIVTTDKRKARKAEIERTRSGARPMPADLFPDLVYNEETGIAKILATLGNAAALLQYYGINVSYDVIQKKTAVIVPGATGSPDNADNSSMTRVISLAALNEIPTDKIPGYVQVLADERQVNPVADWIFSRPWDQVDRIQALCETLQIVEGYPADMRYTLVRKWLISAVAAVVMPSGFRCRGVLTLQSPQSTGKTSWLDSLVSDPVLREQVILSDWQYDAANKDTVIQAVSHWLVEIGELDGSFRKSDIARIKGFLTRRTDKIRRPYDRAESEYPRRTVFFASVNDSQFLVDETGNTRFWTVAVKGVNYRHQIDVQQLWAQVAELQQSGEEWWLTRDEEEKLEQINNGYRTASSVRDLIVSRHEWEVKAESLYRRKSAAEVLIAVGIDRPTNSQCREAGHILRELAGEPSKSKGVCRWAVPPVTFVPDSDENGG